MLASLLELEGRTTTVGHMEKEEREKRADRQEGWEILSLRRNRRRKPPFTIFIANLTFDTLEEDLLRIFGRYGKLEGVYIPTDLITKLSKGYAFATFRYEQEAINAANCLHGRRIDGRVVTLTWARRKIGQKNQGGWNSVKGLQRANPRLGAVPLDSSVASPQRTYAAAAKGLIESRKLPKSHNVAEAKGLYHQGKSPSHIQKEEAPPLRGGAPIFFISSDPKQVQQKEIQLALALIVKSSQEVSVLHLIDVFQSS